MNLFLYNDEVFVAVSFSTLQLILSSHFFRVFFIASVAKLLLASVCSFLLQ